MIMATTPRFASLENCHFLFLVSPSPPQSSKGSKKKNLAK